MDKKEARHLSEVLKAYSEDRTVQIRTSHGWEDIVDDRTKFCGAPEDYRIKPEPKYRPYANAKEFLKAQKEHGPNIIILGAYYIPTCIKESRIRIRGTWVDYSVLSDKLFHKWQDGTPCGIVEN